MKGERNRRLRQHNTKTRPSALASRSVHHEYKDLKDPKDGAHVFLMGQEGEGVR